MLLECLFFFFSDVALFAVLIPVMVVLGLAALGVGGSRLGYSRCDNCRGALPELTFPDVAESADLDLLQTISGSCKRRSHCLLRHEVSNWNRSGRRRVPGKRKRSLTG